MNMEEEAEPSREENADETKAENEEASTQRSGEEKQQQVQAIEAGDEGVEAQSERQADSASLSQREAATAESLENADGCVDFLQLKDKLKTTTANHTFLMKLCSQQERQVQRMKKKLMQTEREIKEMQSMLRLGDRQMTALREETFDKEFQLHAQLLKVPKEVELEAKKREPMLHKKWQSLKNIEGAVSLLNNIKQRQQSLKHLELMTYQKKLSFEHNLSAATSVTSDKAGKSPPPPPPPRIRTSANEQQTAAKKNAISVENLQARHIYQTILARVRNSSEPVTSPVRADGSSGSEDTSSTLESEV